MLKFFVTLLVLAGVFLAGVTLASDFNFSDMFGFGQSAEAEARAVAAQARAAVEIARITAETDRKCSAFRYRYFFPLFQVYAVRY